MNRLACLTILLLSIPLRARAADDRAADAMIGRGLELRREGKPDEALELFQRAYALSPSPRNTGQMGFVEGTLEHWTDAETHLTAALAVAADPWVRKNHALLEDALITVKGHIGELVFSGPAGASVTVAGKLVGTLPSIPPVHSAPGTVLITASASGAKQFSQTVTVQSGMQMSVTIALEPIDVPPPRPVAGVESPLVASDGELLQRHSSRRAWAGGALIGAGASIVTWGIVWIAVDGNTAAGSCTTTASPCKPVYNTKTAGWILTAGGAATAAVGGILLFKSRNAGTDVAVGLAPSALLLNGHF